MRAQNPQDASDDQSAPTAGASAIRAFQLDARGLARVLGSLEAELLECLWTLTTENTSSSPGAWVTVHDVLRALGPGAHYKTVQTVLNRLVEKGLLARRDQNRPHTYHPTMTRDELLTSVTRTILQGLVSDFGDVALAQLVHAADAVTPEHRAVLEMLIRTPETDDADNANDADS